MALTQDDETVISKRDNETECDFPQAIGNPARRALANAGYTRLEHLTRLTEKEFTQMHGIGPKALRLLAAALADHGLSFRSDGKP